MASDDESRSAAATEIAQDDRLESWKDIAVYLHRDVTTVQRWEKREGLPVRRLQHQKLGSVYALKSEMDAWRTRKLGKRRARSRALQWLAAPIAAALVVAAVALLRDGWARQAGADRAAVASDALPAETWDAVAFPLTADLGDEAEPAISPDGSLVAFVSNRPESTYQYDLFVKQVTGGNPVRVAVCPPSQDCFSPAWSPDGERLAFLRHVPGKQVDGGAAMFVVPALGGPEQRVGSVLASGGGLSWFPDGRRIALSSRQGTAAPRISIVSVETGTVQPFSHPPTGSFDAHPAVTSDGQTVAFVRNRFDWPYSTVLTQSIADTRETRLPLSDRRIAEIGWLPRSSDLLVSSDGSLLRVPARGGAAVRIPLQGRVGRFSAALTMSRVALVNNTTQRDVWGTSGPAAMNRTAPRRAVFSSTRDEARATYSPDGRRIAFVTDRSGRFELWTCSAGEQDCARLPVPPRFEGMDRPAWSPDSRRLAFEGTLLGEQTGTFYIFDFLERTVQALAKCPPNSRNMVWSADGTHIYFSPDEALQKGVWKAPVDGHGPLRQVVDDRNLIPVAEDGGYLYLLRFNDASGRDLTATMSRLSLADGRKEELPGTSMGRYAMWNKKIVFVELHDGGASASLTLLDPGSRARRILGNVPPDASQPSVSPDGTRVLFTHVILERDLMVVDLKPR